MAKEAIFYLSGDSVLSQTSPRWPFRRRGGRSLYETLDESFVICMSLAEGYSLTGRFILGAKWGSLDILAALRFVRGNLRPLAFASALLHGNAVKDIFVIDSPGVKLIGFFLPRFRGLVGEMQ